MLQFLPFRGWRFNSGFDLSRVVCPPYDVIKGAARDALLEKDAHNIVAVELAARYGETASEADYQKSAQTLQSWIESGVLVRDDSAFYVYEQEFAHPTSGQILKRRGILGALTLEELGDNIAPHEYTLSGPKADRLNLLRATRTNTSPIFGIARDDDGWINGLITDVVLSAPHAQFRDEGGITHRLWVVRDDETVNGFEAAFENERMLIADGHHRFETALNFWRENGEKSDSSSAVMTFIVSSLDDGLVVLPTHRVVKNVESEKISTLLSNLETDFQIESGHEPQSGEIGLILPEGTFVLRPKNGAGVGEKSAAYNALEVAILHAQILEKRLGIGESELRSGNFLTYTIHVGEAQNYVSSGQAQAAFLLPPSPVSTVQNVADAGDRMPQKSTYFFPKIVTGLVLRTLD